VNLDTGIDTLNYSGSSSAVEVDLGAGTASGFASIGGIEDVTGGSGNDNLTGGAVANRLAGGARNDKYHVGTVDRWWRDPAVARTSSTARPPRLP
jgi:Ca2+-binding RTX toxin-like protein